ncbi:hypothetical protein JW905_10160 [bacterium]|nr:hypothetical protein [candidate division CSSED10-310 bacterium]
MDKVKSALEIALERASKVTVSAAERLAFKQEEARQEMVGLVRRFISGETAGERLLEWARRVDVPGVDGRVLLVRQLVSYFDREPALSPVLNLLEQLGLSAGDALRARLREVHDRLAAAQAADDESGAEMELRRLKEKGISGSAVRPHNRRQGAAGESVEEVYRMFAVIQQWCLRNMEIPGAPGVPE